MHLLDMNQDIISITGRRMSILLLVRVLMGMWEWSSLPK